MTCILKPFLDFGPLYVWKLKVDMSKMFIKVGTGAKSVFLCKFLCI